MKKRVFPAIAIALLLIGVPGALISWERIAPDGSSNTRNGIQFVISPFTQSVRWTAVRLSEGLEYLVTSGLVRRENSMLERKIAHLEAENSFLRENLSKYERLDKGSALAEINNWKMVQADVIAYSGGRWSRSLIIRRDRSGSISVGNPVLHVKGLAGVVTSVRGSVATVQLLSDPQSSVGVVVLPMRAHGMVKGTGRHESLEIVLEDSTVQLQPGQQIISSGMQGSLYPKGLPVGTVGSLKLNRFGQIIAEVHPSVAFGRIEEVLVLSGDVDANAAEKTDAD